MLSLLASGISAAATSSQDVWPWWDPTLTSEERARALVAEMTFDEKAQTLTMSNGPLSFIEEGYVGGFQGSDRLNLPKIRYNDGPQGFRNQHATKGSSTAFPSLLAVGMTWNPDLAHEMSEAIGEEFFDKGAHVHLGPAVNVQRVPYAGRNFEYISGEDPVIGAKMAPPMIKGVQSKNVMANIKHFADNS